MQSTLHDPAQSDQMTFSTSTAVLEPRRSPRGSNARITHLVIARLLLLCVAATSTIGCACGGALATPGHRPASAGGLVGGILACMSPPVPSTTSPTPGVDTVFRIPTSGSDPISIATGPDHNLWFTENVRNKIGRITPSGTITEFGLPISR
jgi:streptogramin lyase